MDYYLVNNGYHVVDLLALTDQTQRKLIVVPHQMNIEIPQDSFVDILNFQSPFGTSMFSWLNLFGLMVSKKRFRAKVAVSPSDRLFVYTEFELFNHVIIDEFKSKGAQVFLIEEGLATYTVIPSHGRRTFKSFLGNAWVQYGLRLKNSIITEQASGIFPFQYDAAFSGMITYGEQRLEREIEKIPIIRNACKKKIKRDSKKILFLSEPLYDCYMDLDGYLLLLDDCIAHLSAEFSELFFKFHPRENQEIREKIALRLSRYNVRYVNTNSPAEMLAREMDFGCCASFICTALLPMSELGVEPIFLIHFIEGCHKNVILANVEKMLVDAGVILPSRWSEIFPGSSFSPQRSTKAKTFSECFHNG